MRSEPPADARSPSHSALLVAGVYALVGWLWIVLSGPILDSFFAEPARRAEAEVLTGLIFVAITALTLFVVVRFVLRRRNTRVRPVFEQNQRFLHHMEHTPLALVEWDREFRVERWSPSAEKLFGWTAAEARGRKWDEWELVHPDDGQSLRTLLSSIPHSNPGGTSLVLRHVTKDGREIWCEWQLSWRRNAEGRLTLLSMVQDVTRDREAMSEVQRINLELELQVARRTRELARANRDLRAFTQSVSKDLRAPVRSVISFAENLRDEFGDDLPTDARRNLVYILAAGRQIDHLIEDLLEYAGLGSGEISRIPVDVHDLTRSVVADLEGDFPEALSAVTLPRSAVTAQGDPDLMARVLRNLLENALKYRETSRPPKVEVSAERREREVLVRVRDNGPGIPETQREAIFRLFHRLHDMQSHPGTGMGLAVVRKAMGLMGGTVSVEDHSGPGTTFVLGFPTEDDLAEAAPHLENPAQGPDDGRVYEPGVPPSMRSASAP